MGAAMAVQGWRAWMLVNRAIEAPPANQQLIARAVQSQWPTWRGDWHGLRQTQSPNGVPAHRAGPSHQAIEWPRWFAARAADSASAHEADLHGSWPPISCVEFRFLARQPYLIRET